MTEKEHDDYCLQTYDYQFQADLLKDKVAFITGGASGIGFRIAELFMRHGCKTIIGSRRLKKLKESAYELESGTGQPCLPVQVDVRNYDSIVKGVKEGLAKFGRIDILVNNAAGNFLSPISNLSPNGFRTVMEIDAFGTFNATKALYECWFKQSGGVVINISATLYYRGDALQLHAGTAKAAIDAMTKHIAVEWGPQNIRINCIAPGPIESTEGMRKLAGSSAEVVDGIISSVPLRRMGTRTDIAETALFLASPLSSYVTGTVLIVDGGAWMTFKMSEQEVFSKL